MLPLEIPSLKPARICTSRSRGHCRSGLGSASAARRTFCERFAGPSVGGGTRVAAGDPVPVARSDLFLTVSRPLQGCTQLPVPAPSPQREGPPARGLQVSLEQKSPSLQYSVASGCRIHRELVPSSRSVGCGFRAMYMCVFLLRHLGSTPPLITFNYKSRSGIAGSKNTHCLVTFWVQFPKWLYPFTGSPTVH